MIAKTKRLTNCSFHFNKNDETPLMILKGWGSIELTPSEARALRDFLNKQELGTHIKKPCYDDYGIIMGKCDNVCGHDGTWEDCTNGKLHGRAK